MKNLFTKLHEWVSQHKDAVLVTVIASSGSIPRGAGAKMIVYPTGETFGTIGGGAVEYKAQQLALTALQEQKSYVQGFHLAPNEIADLGMICGGNVEVFFQYIDGNNPTILSTLTTILTFFTENTPSWLITTISEETNCTMTTYGGSPNQFILDQEFISLDSNSKLIEHHGKKYYIEPLFIPGKVYIFGGGHISQSLVPALHSVGFRCSIVDDKTEFANISRFPLAEEIHQLDFTNFSTHITIEPWDYMIIVTRGHSYDYHVLAQALKTPACYIGMIGSRTKLGKTKENLFAEGFTQEDFDRVYAPIGLKIKAVTPEEIAISITAELIQVRAQLRESNNSLKIK